MKYFGYVFIAIGLGILVFILFQFWNKNDELVSPVPDSSGVKVIQLSPAP